MEDDRSMDNAIIPFVRLSFDVTDSGRAKNVNIISESQPSSYRVRSNAKQLIKTATFRPRLQDGKLVATESTELLLAGEQLLQSPPQSSRQPDLRSTRKLRY
jgi:hypothetical protein